VKDKLKDLALFWLRLTFGVGMMVHGWLKLSGGVGAWIDNSVVPMGLPIPVVFGWLAVITEFFGGFLLILGLWTRLVAFAAIIFFVVAAFVRNAGNPFIAPGGPNRELPLAYLVVVVFLLMSGAGRFSVDGSRGKGGGGKSAAKKSKR